MNGVIRALSLPWYDRMREPWRLLLFVGLCLSALVVDSVPAWTVLGVVGFCRAALIFRWVRRLEDGKE